MTAGYVELQVTTNYSFLIGGSHPHELVAAAAALGQTAIAVTDRNSLAGVVRAYDAAQQVKSVRLLVGARLDFSDFPSLICLPTDRAAYGRLSRLLSTGRLRAPKGECHLSGADLEALGDGQLLIALPPDRPDGAFAEAVARLPYRRRWLAATHRYDGDDKVRLHRLAGFAGIAGVPLVATNDVHYHAPERRPLQDVLTCIRLGCTIDEAGFRLAANAERHLKPAAEMARLFQDYPEAVAATGAIADQCRFSLKELAYDYPDEITTDGRSPQAELEHLLQTALAERYPHGVPAKVSEPLARELALTAERNYAPYFLTVYDAVRFARDNDILCQGRGSAANSVICYLLGITNVDPERIDVLFERFVSTERKEPPDIDVDFEHERREEVIQHIYDRYGRDRAALTASVSCYRMRGAIREVGKALGLSLDTVAKLAGSSWGWSMEEIPAERVRELGLDPAAPRLRLALDLARELLGFPRHLSQHVGGFVITRGSLTEVVPVTNAAMEDRTVIEWDKADLDVLGILKIDVLALGMLTCVRKAFDLIARHGKGEKLTLDTVPREDPQVYDMLCRADSLGVFQVESRAQMSMLPRLKPREFYDLVIEVAIVRPGPIQGDMVHPYLRRRSGQEKVEYPKKELEDVLGKTLGVPLFQEQAMRIAMVAANFTPAEADRLRRAMATFRHNGTIHELRDKMIEGMVANGYARDFAERCFKQIEGFGSYGFPESHAASFAHLVYISSWIKCLHPAAFCAALLNSQPMGFYAPAQIVRDARDHGVAVLAVDVNRSDWDCTLEDDPGSAGGLAVRLGLRSVKGASKPEMEALMQHRGAGYDSPHQLHRRSGLPVETLVRLAAADAFRSMGLDRRAAEWAIRGLDAEPLPLFAQAAAARPEPAVALPAMPLGEHVAHDYSRLGLSLKAHPMALLRGSVRSEAVVTAASLATARDGRRLSVAGLVLVRQRPGSASGTIFVTLEDETGIANLIVWPHRYEVYRRVVLTSALMVATGRVQREGLVVHLVVEHLVDHTDKLALLTRQSQAEPAANIRRLSRDFR